MKLEDVKENDLPDELRRLPPAQRQARLDQTLAERRTLTAKLDGLSKSREEWLKKNAASHRADTFDSRLLESLRAEASRKGIAY